MHVDREQRYQEALAKMCQQIVEHRTGIAVVELSAPAEIDLTESIVWVRGMLVPVYGSHADNNWSTTVSGEED